MLLYQQESTALFRVNMYYVESINKGHIGYNNIDLGTLSLVERLGGLEMFSPR